MVCMRDKTWRVGRMSGDAGVQTSQVRSENTDDFWSYRLPGE